MEASMSAITNQEGRFATHGGLELYYQSWVAHDRPTRGTVVIAHGIGEHSSAYRTVVERLVPAGFALYGFDLRGHGRSPGQRAYINSWDDYRQDLRAFMRFVQSQQPSQPLFLLGHSMGGIIVLDYALRYPEGLRGVIAIGPAIGQIVISPVLMAIARLISRVRPTFSMKSGLDVTAISRDPQVIATYKADPLVHDVGTARLASESEKTVAWIQEHAADLRVPILVQHGEADHIALPDGSRRFVSNVSEPDKELHEYSGAFHQVHNDIGHDVAIADLLAWLEQHLSPASGDQNP
jgi:alpha-beta hydrolase superfamily lysophospholipase